MLVKPKVGSRRIIISFQTSKKHVPHIKSTIPWVYPCSSKHCKCARWLLDPTKRWTDYSRTVSWTKTRPNAYPSHQKSRDRAHLASLCGTSRTCLRPSLASLSSHFLLVAFQNRNCYKIRGDYQKWYESSKMTLKGHLAQFWSSFHQHQIVWVLYTLHRCLQLPRCAQIKPPITCNLHATKGLLLNTMVDGRPRRCKFIQKCSGCLGFAPRYDVDVCSQIGDPSILGQN